MKAAFAAPASNVGLTPLEFMLGIMKDPAVAPQLRLKAAESAAPYVHPKPGRSQASDPSVNAKPIDGVCEAEARGRMLELAFQSWSGTLSAAEVEELETLEKAYPPDPNDPLWEAAQAWDRAIQEFDRIETSKAGPKR
jgi:hypothetical protein